MIRLAFLLSILPITALHSAPTSPEAPGIPGPSPELLHAALSSVDCAQRAGHLGPGTPRRLTVIDYTLPSTEPRLWVLDPRDGRVLLRERVAHGQGSGEQLAVAFSDEAGSKQTSLGLFRTAETYQGQHGYSLRLDGLEPGLNGSARSRAIVIHGADYAREGFVQDHGRLGRSWGCPAVRPEIVRTLVDEIKEGTPVFAWSADPLRLEASPLLRCE